MPEAPKQVRGLFLWSKQQRGHQKGMLGYDYVQGWAPV